MTPGELRTPPELLYRIDRATKAQLFVPDHRPNGWHRFDHPGHGPTFGVLYAGQRRACFYEVLPDFRPSTLISGPRNQTAQPRLNRSWLDERRLWTFHLHDPDAALRWLDCCNPATYPALRPVFLDLARQHGFADFTLSAVTTENRQLTQEIALWAFEQGYAGIRYPTRHSLEHHCWAIFSGPRQPTLAITSRRRIRLNDPDLLRVILDFGIQWPIPG